ncbi:MAG: ABC transporter ATP-binding protein [Pseudomonadota bacterium]
MIHVDVRQKRFGDRAVLADIAFALERGETLAIVGPSGIGKSTLLRIVAGLDVAFEGTVSGAHRIGFVFQEPTLLPWRPLLANLMIAHPKAGDGAAREMLAAVGLAGREAELPRQLSLGQQRRLSLARALLGAPELLILDEPFASLDRETHGEMLRLTERLIAEHRPATLLVTHDPGEASRLAGRVGTLAGSPARLEGMT